MSDAKHSCSHDQSSTNFCFMLFTFTKEKEKIQAFVTADKTNLAYL
jgi:hypothetical protein